MAYIASLCNTALGLKCLLGSSRSEFSTVSLSRSGSFCLHRLAATASAIENPTHKTNKRRDLVPPFFSRALSSARKYLAQPMAARRARTRWRRPQPTPSVPGPQPRSSPQHEKRPAAEDASHRRTTTLQSLHSLTMHSNSEARKSTEMATRTIYGRFLMRHPTTQSSLPARPSAMLLLLALSAVFTLFMTLPAFAQLDAHLSDFNSAADERAVVVDRAAASSSEDTSTPGGSPGDVPLKLTFIPSRVTPTTTTKGNHLGPNIAAQPTTTRRLTPNWGLCRLNSQCSSRCCSSKMSSDKRLRCHPANLNACLGNVAVVPTTKRRTTKKVTVPTNNLAGSLPLWEYCSGNAMCSTNCCSNKYSNDGRYKCHAANAGGCLATVPAVVITPAPARTTPRVIPTTAAPAPPIEQYDLWIPCYANNMCKSNCCSIRWSSDGIWKCHPTDVCAQPTTNRPPVVPTRTAKSYGNKADFGIHVSWGNAQNLVQYADGSLAAVAAKVGFDLRSRYGRVESPFADTISSLTLFFCRSDARHLMSETFSPLQTPALPTGSARLGSWTTSKLRDPFLSAT